MRAAFIWPALLAILFVSIYPLLASLYISLSRLKLVRGGFEFRFVGLDNFRELLVGGTRHLVLTRIDACPFRLRSVPAPFNCERPRLGGSLSCDLRG